MDRKERGREAFYRYKGVLKCLSSFYGLFPLRVRIRILAMHRNTGGKLGYGIRYALVKSIAKKCGDNVSIAQNVFLLNPQNLIIGSNVSIHPMCYLECGKDNDNYIQIDNDVSIAHGVTIITTSHTYNSDLTNIIKDMKVIWKPVHICSNVWIGAKVTILMGTTIKSGCVIGANSLVNKDTEPNGVYVGTPIRRIKDREPAQD